MTTKEKRKSFFNRENSNLSYSKITANPKVVESVFKSETSQLVKDIEDKSKKDAELLEKCAKTFHNDEYRLKLRDFKVEPNGCSLLHIAAKNCRTKVCKFLLEEIRIDINFRCQAKMTPMHYLVKSNIFSKSDSNLDKQLMFCEIFKLFIEKSCDINARDENGQSILHLAALKNNYIAVLLLIDLPGISLNIEDEKNQLPFHFSCKNGNEDILSLLIDKMDAQKLSNIILSDIGLSPLHTLCRNKTEKFSILKKILEKLIQNDTSPEQTVFEQLLKKEDSARQTVLHISIENSHLNIVEMLFRDFNMNRELREGQKGNLPIHVCAKSGSIEMFKLLQKYDAVSFKQNNQLENALHIAASFNKPKFIEAFLKFEHLLMDQNNVYDDEVYVKCACDCGMGKDYVPCVKVKDNKEYTPLFTALSALNQQCFVMLLNDQNCDFNSVDKSENSVYHIATMFDNAESLKYILDNFTNDKIFSKNLMEDTILHCACRNGNISMVKQIMAKMLESNVSLDSFLLSKNKDGDTAFHICCTNGFSNIIEYFLKDKKLTLFLDVLDNSSNSPLHLAVVNGHSTIVKSLIEFGAEVNVKNEEDLSPLDYSCRKGYFEISKNIIASQADSDEKIDESAHNDSDHPLHVACFEGAHEVVKLLLVQGAPIEKLNKENKNCLDIAISRGHKEVIRVLLDDKNWLKLFRTDSHDQRRLAITESDYLSRLGGDTDFEAILIDSNQTKLDKEKPKESPQLVALSDAKMWEMLKIILDKSLLKNEFTDETNMDFTLLDPPLKDIAKHPLMLIACSGQENLLQHEVIRSLLHLKWRFIPRSVFYFNIFFYLIFLTLFSAFSLELSEITAVYKDYKDNLTLTNDFIRRKDYSFFNDDNTRTLLVNLLIFQVCFQLFMELLQVIFIDRYHYFLSMQNMVEVSTFSISLISLLHNDIKLRCAFASIAILMSFILFPLYIEKMSSIGIYVVAFKRTLMNSAKFFPIFLILFIGFVLSFNLRTNFGLTFYRSGLGPKLLHSNQSDGYLNLGSIAAYSVLRTFTMVMGELETDKMGLNSDFYLNFIIYAMFLTIMCTIVLNLFVGIAVGEIKTVLDEAKTSSIAMRISFVLKIQSAIDPFTKRFTCFKFMLNMTFKSFNSHGDHAIINWVNSLYTKFLDIVSTTEQDVILADPQKRLEDQFMSMSEFTSEQIKGLRYGKLKYLSLGLYYWDKGFVTQAAFTNCIILVHNCIN